MDSTNRETRLRLLEAAGEVFAEQGFHRATIRDICSRADANIAAVNYHFGDKERLYVAVIQHWLGEAACGNIRRTAGCRPMPRPQGGFYAFVRSWLFRMLGEGMPAWHGKLMAREMSEPTAAFDVLLSETVRPMSQRLTAIVRELLRPNVDEQTVQDCAMSVAGQCCFRRHAHEMIRRLYPDQHYTSERIEQLARHVTDFSLAAIEAYSQRARS